MASKGAAKGATKNAGAGAKAGMQVGPTKPSGGMPKVARPVIRNEPIGGVGKTNPKAQPMYPGKASKLGKTTVQLDKLSRSGSGIVDDDGKGYNNNMPDSKKGSGRPV